MIFFIQSNTKHIYAIIKSEFDIKLDLQGFKVF